MSKTMTRLMVAGLLAVALPSFAGVASAAPATGALALKNAAPAQMETVRWYGRGGWGWGRGWGYWGGGFAAGAVIGGLLAAPYYYGGYPYYYGGYYGAAPYYGGYYSEPGYYAEPYAGGGAVDYCLRRYRTYDPNTGTFMGNDGRRHPCP